jgi:hypothetical protein
VDVMVKEAPHALGRCPWHPRPGFRGSSSIG